MEIVREMAARLGLDVDENAFEVADGLLGTVKKGLAGLGIVAGAAALGIAAMVGKTVQAAGALSDLASRTGLDVVEFQKLAHAAGLAGVNTEELAQALNFSAKKGVKDLPKHLQNTADQIRKLASEGRRAEAVALAMERFGRSGAMLLPLLEQGGDAVAATMAEAEELGFVMGGDLVTAGDTLGDNFDRLMGAGRGIAHTIGAELIPGLVDLTDRAIAWWKVNRKEVMGAVVAGFRAISKVVSLLGVGLRFLAESWRAIALVLGSVVLAALIANAAAVYSVTAGYIGMALASTVAAAKAALAWAIAAWPLIALAALIAAVILIVEDLWTSFTGGEGLILGLLEDWTRFYDSILKDDADDWWITRMIKAAARALADLQGSFEKLQAWWDSGLSKVATVVLNHMQPGGLFRGAGGASSPAAAAALQTSATPPAVGGNSVNMGGVTIVQQPGENSEELAKRVRWEVADILDARDRETEAALGPVP